MAASQQLHEFMERLFAINPTVVFGGTGKSGISPNTSTAAHDVIRGLREAANDFGRLTVLGQPAEAAAREVEGHLLALQTLNQITSRLCDDLTHELHDLIKR